MLRGRRSRWSVTRPTLRCGALEGVRIDIKLSQNDFARLAMGSRQRVNGIFRDWDKNGLVETRGEHLLIKDVEALEKELLPFEKPVTWVTGD